jgi:hypothetical protein
MADNPSDLKYGKGLLGFLDGPPAAKPTNALADLRSTPGVSDLFGALSPQSSLSPFSLAGPHPTTSNALSSAAVSDLFGAMNPPSAANTFGSGLGAVADLFASSPPANTFGSLGAVADLFAPTPPSPLGLGALSGHFPWTDPLMPFGVTNPPPPPPKPLAPPKQVAPAVKRRAFFSFHFDDIMRVNVVRNAWKITHPDNALMRSFYDSSLWESKKLEGPEAVKSLIRDGVCNTSAVCVLAGSDTWERRWVRYEIARAIIEGRGLLTVHLNSIRHHVTKTPHTRGYNPLAFMAIGKLQESVWDPVRYFLFERQLVANGGGGRRWEWHRYADYMLQVDLPSWVADPKVGLVTPLSDNSDEYDYIADGGHRNIGSWIDQAARRAGR